MASPTVDRRLGLVGNTAIKAPVTVVATSNITLSGQQTIDGVAVLASNAAGVPDRVLCTGQTSASQNGIWDVSTGSWTRANDADGNYDFAQGTTVLVNQGTTYNGTYWKLTTSGTITVGTTSQTWSRALTNSASEISFLQAGTGAVARGSQDKMRDIISVKDFGATGDGVTNDAAAIQAAITAANALGGAMVYMPEGTYYTGTTTINMAKWVTLQGSGKRGTVITYAGTGDAVKMTSAINSSTAVHTAVRDLGITCTNASSTGACYDDIGGTFVELTNLALTGGKFGVIFDQTELATIRLCDIEAQCINGAGIWLVNGPDHTIGASSQFTNRILITENQFNNGGQGAVSHIIDDGGVAHEITFNNFNSGRVLATPPVCRFAGVLRLTFFSNYMEGGQTMLAFDSTAFYSGSGAGLSAAVTIQANIISMSQPNTPITLAAGANPMALIGNWFGGGSAYKVTGASLNGSISAFGNVYTSGVLLDSSPTYLAQFDNLGNRVNQLLSIDGGVGYGTGAGGTVTQAAGSKANGVTLNKITGEIVLSNANIAANTTVQIPFTNSMIGANDVVHVHRKSGGTAGAYKVWCDSTAAGSCQIGFQNDTGGALAEVVTLQFAVVPSVVA